MQRERGVVESESLLDGEGPVQAERDIDQRENHDDPKHQQGLGEYGAEARCGHEIGDTRDSTSYGQAGDHHGFHNGLNHR